MENNFKQKIVVFNVDIPELDNNRLFIPEIAKKISHTLLPICYLSRMAEEKGIKFITPDVYLKMDPKPSALLISHLITVHSSALIKRSGGGIKPTILTCQESPFIATRFYLGLLFFSRNFKYSFVFSGMRRMVSMSSSYRQMFFPQPYSISDFNPESFRQKRLITMVSSAKSVNNYKKSLLLKIIYGFSVKEIYSERLRAINYFSRSSDFDLYGRGWDKILINIETANFYKGVIEDKFNVLKNYKFTLCFENSIFPGYITEKIFDAIFAGSVPIYYGAPDVKNYIPANVFINFRDFKDYDELNEYITSINEEEYNNYLTAMRDFILSDAYTKFNQQYFSESLIKILEKEFKEI